MNQRPVDQREKNDPNIYCKSIISESMIILYKFELLNQTRYNAMQS